MYGFIAILHLVGFGVLLGLVVPHGYRLGGDHPVFSVGVGLLAYTLGLRHAFDADHIAAVDNTTRKLIADNLKPGLKPGFNAELGANNSREGRGDLDGPELGDDLGGGGIAGGGAEAGVGHKPLAVGFWFSLGHSTIVFVLAVFLAAGVKALAGPLEDDDSTLHVITGLIGPSVSGVFLWILGILNLAALIGILKVFGELRHGDYDETELERRLNSRGLMNRMLGGLTKSVTKPWHIYPIGVLFGLGFDTATEVGLLVLAGGAATLNLPFYAILVLPILFAAGMCLLDTTDGVFMNAAYGWAFAKPVRKIFYNITITSLSVAVALIIGTLELVGVLTDRLGISSGPLAWIAGIDLDYVGYAIVGIFVIAWLLAIAVWRLARIEERWTTDPAT